jgi:hypothetical protein
MFRRSLGALGLSLALLAPAYADSTAQPAKTEKPADTEPGRKATDEPPAEKSASEPGDKSAGDERSAKQKKEQGEKKGALKERVDPAKDAKAQRANIAQLKQNAAVEKKNGNHVGAWAADGDRKHAEKLLEKDEKLLQEGKTKQAVDGQTVKH